MSFYSDMRNKYFLIANICNKSYVKYQGSARSISEEIPRYYDEVWIGVRKHPEKTRKITTFKDKNGNIIERAFDYSDGKLRNRLYSRESRNIDRNEHVVSVTIKDFSINKRVIPYYEELLEDFQETKPLKTLLWNLKETITNHTSINKKTGEKIISQVKIDKLDTPTKQRHTFTEFPHILNDRIQKGKKKFLSFFVNGYTDKVKTDSVVKQGVRFPESDTYLAYRALTIDDSKEPLTRRYIKEKKLQNTLIEINTDYYPKNEDDKLYAADFTPDNGSINFNRLFKPYSKARVARMARHEVEHGWQYFLRSRVAPPTTEWEEFISTTFGAIKSKKLFREAKRYTKSIKNYVALTKELEEAGKVQEYKDNYIEIKARKTGQKARTDYDKQGKSIRNSFKHIPHDFL